MKAIARRARTSAVVVVLAAGAIGCETRTGDEMTYGPASSPPWKVGGVTIGMTIGEVGAILGPPEKSRDDYGRTNQSWRNPEVGVTFDRDGKAVDSLSDRLQTPAGEVVVQRGASEAEVVGRLGKGSVKGSYRPSGSGVISCGMTRIGAEHRYEDATTAYSVGVYEDRLSYVRALPRQGR